MNRVASFFAALVFGALALSGCTGDGVAPMRPAECEERIDIPDMDVCVFRLKDGTRCAAMDGNQSGGISCEWRIATAARVVWPSPIRRRKLYHV